MSKFVWAQSHVSQDCHRDVARLSRDVADVSPDVTEMSRPSHIFVTRCHKLSQQLSHQSRSVTECQYICRRVDMLTYPSWSGGSSPRHGSRRSDGGTRLDDSWRPLKEGRLRGYGQAWVTRAKREALAHEAAHTTRSHASRHRHEEEGL